MRDLNSMQCISQDRGDAWEINGAMIFKYLDQKIATVKYRPNAESNPICHDSFVCFRAPVSTDRFWPRPDAGACNGRELPLSMRFMQRSHTWEPFSIWPGGFRKSADKLSENPSPYRPKASRAVFEEI